MLRDQRRNKTNLAFPPPTSLPLHALITQTHAILYASVMPNQIVVPIVYFSLLFYPSTIPVYEWVQYGQHATILFSACVELTLSRILLPWSGMIVVFLVGLAYMFYMWIIAFTLHFWPYPFLDWENGQGSHVWYWYIILFVLFCLAFLVIKGLTWIREWIARRLGKSGPFQGVDSSIQSPLETHQAVHEDHRFQSLNLIA